MSKHDYSRITESPGMKASQEQLARIWHRYRMAADYIQGKEVLEVACGSGTGLGFLARYAKRIVGGDIDRKNVATAQALYDGGQEGIRVQEMDAHALPFTDRTFDVVLLFEAIYYLEYPEVFVAEASRVLRPGGLLILCTVNRDWDDFHPSPYTHRYLSVPELGSLLNPTFQEIRVYGAFSTQTVGLRGKAISLLKRLAVKWDLIPGSLAARAYLKRIFMGALQPLPEQLHEGMAPPFEPPQEISLTRPNRDHKIIYALAFKRQEVY
jgi:SAM-dependent methyltransferase